ncbi:MAG: hypothetical protein GC179_30690 [Anaerolineaceae bacterium]|nr:hypothetical protein [Anaerolineaceae bacterium]
MNEATNGTQRKALGRGLASLLGDAPATEMLTAAEAIPAIVSIVERVPAKYHPVIYQSVDALRRAEKAEADEVAAIGEHLNELARARVQRETAPKRRGWFRS